jgi:hypothetical protein
MLNPHAQLHESDHTENFLNENVVGRTAPHSRAGPVALHLHQNNNVHKSEATDRRIALSRRLGGVERSRSPGHRRRMHGSVRSHSLHLPRAQALDGAIIAYPSASRDARHSCSPCDDDPMRSLSLACWHQGNPNVGGCSFATVLDHHGVRQ